MAAARCWHLVVAAVAPAAAPAVVPAARLAVAPSVVLAARLAVVVVVAALALGCQRATAGPACGPSHDQVAEAVTAVTAAVALAIAAVVVVVVRPACHRVVVAAVALASGHQMVTVAPAYGPSHTTHKMLYTKRTSGVLYCIVGARGGMTNKRKLM